MEIELKCEICFEEYDDERYPITNNCGHTFCFFCIKTMCSKGKSLCFNCKYPGMNPYGSKNFLILELASQLKNKHKVKNNHNSK